jgi:hypothetical protein
MSKRNKNGEIKLLMRAYLAMTEGEGTEIWEHHNHLLSKVMFTTQLLTTHIVEIALTFWLKSKSKQRRNMRVLKSYATSTTLNPVGRSNRMKPLSWKTMLTVYSCSKTMPTLTTLIIKKVSPSNLQGN